MVMLHQLAAAIKFRQEKGEVALAVARQDFLVPTRGSRWDWVASHRCRSSRICFRLGHIVLETQRSNVSRMSCKVRVFCPDCSEGFDMCGHKPRCTKHGP